MDFGHLKIPFFPFTSSDRNSSSKYKYVFLWYWMLICSGCLSRQSLSINIIDMSEKCRLSLLKKDISTTQSIYPLDYYEWKESGIYLICYLGFEFTLAMHVAWHQYSLSWLTLNKHFFFSWVSPFAIFLLKRNFFEILHYSSYLFLKTPKPYFYLFDDQMSGLDVSWVLTASILDDSYFFTESQRKRPYLSFRLLLLLLLSFWAPTLRPRLTTTAIQGGR